MEFSKASSLFTIYHPRKSTILSFVFIAFTEQCAGAGTKCAINDGSNQSPAVRGYVLTLIDVSTVTQSGYESNSYVFCRQFMMRINLGFLMDHK